MRVALLVATLFATVAAASADVVVPSGFTVSVYASGEGFGQSSGLPSTSTLGVDDAGFLDLARTGRRYTGGEVEDLFRLYRIPPGGARVSVATEARYFYGPPLPNPQVAAVRGRDVFVTTFDRDRKIGVLYRLRDGEAEMLAGGTPPRGEAPLLRQPEGAAVDGRGHIYVADREQNVVIKLDSAGRVLAAKLLEIVRPRALSIDAGDRLWIGADVGAEAPWQQGPGEFWMVTDAAGARLVTRGPVAAGLAAGKASIVLANRQAAALLVVTEDGQTLELARFTDGDVPRGLTIAPITAATRQSGIAGDLFVAVIRRGLFTVNEIVRISGPLESFIRDAAPRR